MARGRPWTSAEDERIRAVAAENAKRGITRRRKYQHRLEKLAEELNRTYAAVQRRASRIGARSFCRRPPKPPRPIVCPPNRGGRGRPWTEFEDERIRKAARENAEQGIGWHGIRETRITYSQRLRKLAEELGRTYAAVRKRASRLGAKSSTPGKSRIRCLSPFRYI